MRVTETVKAPFFGEHNRMIFGSTTALVMLLHPYIRHFTIDKPC